MKIQYGKTINKLNELEKLDNLEYYKGKWGLLWFLNDGRTLPGSRTKFFDTKEQALERIRIKEENAKSSGKIRTRVVFIEEGGIKAYHYLTPRANHLNTTSVIPIPVGDPND